MDDDKLEELYRQVREAALYTECGLDWPPPCLMEGVWRTYGYELVAQHAERFRRRGERYPVVVTHVYAGDLEAAARDTDEQVAMKVRNWGWDRRIERTDWVRIGRASWVVPGAKNEDYYE